MSNTLAVSAFTIKSGGYSPPLPDTHTVPVPPSSKNITPATPEAPQISTPPVPPVDSDKKTSEKKETPPTNTNDHTSGKITSPTHRVGNTSVVDPFVPQTRDTTKTEKYVFTEKITIYLNSRGDDVIKLQTFLNTHEGSSLNIS